MGGVIDRGNVTLAKHNAYLDSAAKNVMKKKRITFYLKLDWT